MHEHFDVLVIGGGPGGYVAAIRSAQLGLKTALVEKYPRLGGTCLNVGCIPSKTLLDSTEHYHNARKNFEAHGITFENLGFDWSKMQARKDKVIADNGRGLDFLMKKNNIRVFQATASIESREKVWLTLTDGSKDILQTSNIIIASGSLPLSLPGLQIDKKRIISSSQALCLPQVPGRLIIVGAGAIGLEIGSIYRRLGCEVEIIELAERILPQMDESISKELTRCLKKLGLKFHLRSEIKSWNYQDNGLNLKVFHPKTGRETDHTAEYCLVAVGRKPNSQGLNLKNIGLLVNQRGFIQIDKNNCSNIPGIYAVGDVTGGAMLAHKAEEEGIFTAEFIAGRKPYINHDAIPAVVYTWPEAASVGKTTEQLVKEGISFDQGRFFFRALGRSKAAMELDGQVSVLAQKSSGLILGIHMVGPRAADMIAEASLAINNGLKVRDLASTSHPHPSFTEALKEACLEILNSSPIHG